MQHIEGFLKDKKGANLYYQAWLPKEEVKAVLFVAHGLGEHSGRYMNYVNYFVPQGYAMYAMDYLGHGRSDGEREVVSKLEDYTEPLAAYYDMVKTWQAGKPIFILGHSMGTLVGCFHLLDRPGDFKGAIFSGPLALLPDYVSPITVVMGQILSVIAPKTGIINLDVSGLSRDQRVVDDYVNDPLVFHSKTPARLAAQMLRAFQRMTTEADRIKLPFIAIQGGADKIVDPNGAKMLYEKAGSADKTLKIYEGLYHEVHNEPEREVVFKDLHTWLEARVQPATD